MGKLSSGRPTQAARRDKTSAVRTETAHHVREQIQRGRSERAQAIKATLATLPTTRFENHSESHQGNYPSRLKPWHHALLVGLLSGKSQTQMAAELGRTLSRVNIVVNSPLFRQIYDTIVQKRYESVVEGEHGVVAQARAEAPNAMKRIVSISKTARSDGVKLDALKHILALAGAAPVIRTETYSLDKLLTEMDLRELEVFSTTGRVPRRLADMLNSLGRTLPFSEESDAIDVTETTVPIPLDIPTDDSSE